MPRNIEIKARVHDLVDLLRRAKQVSDKAEEILKQVDVFFPSKNGRLKLRDEEVDGKREACLIFYDRPDTKGPKLSTYSKCPLGSSGQQLRGVLAAALGERLAVHKTRHLFMVANTRIHVDEVDGLGNFMELEVGLLDEQTIEDGNKIAKDLMAKLNISETDLLDVAYADMLEKS
ncbi:uncharacterized protein LOC132200517 [Neocloeon triangulifer]|uniref:uncharacterized protein LOC132200517 n=1 Tax=Neocloeon triangulifer TaxID=2078957 RepID=UPI00286F4A62|nr:uncharacterized protein LOC132200517 [Neocloeon triangulifer]